MKQKTKFVALMVAFVMIFATLSACSAGGGETGSKIKTTVVLVLEDKSEVKYEIEVASGSTLRNALHEAKLISDETFGSLFVQDIDGHVANVETDGATWLPTDKDGKQIQGTFDEITVKEGETIYLRYYIVPQMD